MSHGRRRVFRAVAEVNCTGFLRECEAHDVPGSWLPTDVLTAVQTRTVGPLFPSVRTAGRVPGLTGSVRVLSVVAVVPGGQTRHMDAERFTPQARVSMTSSCRTSLRHADWHDG